MAGQASTFTSSQGCRPRPFTRNLLIYVIALTLTQSYPTLAFKVAKYFKGDFNATEYFEGGLWGFWDGKDSSCGNEYNYLLDNSSEFRKYSSAIATTILALLPALLAFTRLVTAQIGLVARLDFLQGIFTAGFTFGLPVTQISTFPEKRIYSIEDLLGDLEPELDQNPDTISENVSANQESRPRIAAEGHSALENFAPEENPVPGNNAPERHSVPGNIAPEGHTVPGNIASEGHAAPGNCPPECLGSVSQASDHDWVVQSPNHPQRITGILAMLQDQLSRDRLPRYSVYSIAFGAIYMQIILMETLLFLLPGIDGIYVIWECPQHGNLIFASWLLAALIVIGFIRAKYEMKRAFPKPLIITLSKLPRGPDEEAGIAIPLPTMVGPRDNQGMYDSYRYMNLRYSYGDKLY